MNKKKLIAGLLAAVLVLSLTACAGGNNKTEDTAGELPEIFWHDRGALTQDHNLVYEEVNKYLAEKIGATVKNVPIVGSEYNEKIQLLLASGEPFDLCFMSSGTQYEIHSANKGFLDIEPYLDEYGKDLKTLVPEYILDAARINGVLYAIPFYKDYAAETVYYYRTDLAEKYNLDFSKVKEFKDLEPILKTIKENEPTIYPLVFNNNDTPFYDITRFDKIPGGVVGCIDMDGDPTKIVNPFDTDKAKEYYKMMHSFYQQGFMRPEIATIDNNNDINDEFMRQQDELPYLVDQRNVTAKYKHSVLHLWEARLGTDNARGAMMSLGRKAKNPEKAVEFLNLLNTDKYLRNLIAYGIEGKHWEPVGEDFYKIPDGFKTLAETGYNTYVFTQGNKYITRMVEGTPADIYDKYKEFDENSVKSPALGFAFIPDNVKSEYSAVSNVISEYMPSLLTGTADPDETLPKAMEKLKAAGVDKLLAEMQKQYDEWLKIK